MHCFKATFCITLGRRCILDHPGPWINPHLCEVYFAHIPNAVCFLNEKEAPLSAEHLGNCSGWRSGQVLSDFREARGQAPGALFTVPGRESISSPSRANLSSGWDRP